jgi:hypothetical protein
MDNKIITSIVLTGAIMALYGLFLGIFTMIKSGFRIW